MLKLLIAEGSEEFRQALAEKLTGAYLIRVCVEGKDALETMRSFRPDLMVLDLMLPGLDGVSLLQRASEEADPPTVLAVSCFFNDYILEALTRLNVGYVMKKPCDIDATIARLADLSGHMNRTAFAKPDPGTEVSNLLLALGFSTKLRGYAYLRDAILEQMRNPGCMMTKELYPAVGKSYRANGAQVERSIRSSIEKAWDGRDEQLWNLYFQPDAAGKQRKPSNAVFISGLATRLLRGRATDTE